MTDVVNESRLSVRFERADFSLEVDLRWSERVLVLFGPSGSGKTTLLEVALGLHRAANARVRLADTWLEDSETGLSLPSRARGLGWVPQDPMLFPHLDVEGNLRFGLARAGATGERSLERAVEVLELGGLRKRFASELSGGERQRVALARALASGPRALLLDEPLAALDLPLRARVLPYLLRVRDEFGLPMLHITHDPDEAMVLGERVAVLDAGRVVATGAPREVLWSRAVQPLSDALGVENVLDACCIAADGDESRLRSDRGLELTVPWVMEPDERVGVGLRAEDILIARDRPGRISARNVIAARVERCDDVKGDVLVHLAAGNETLVARLTRSGAASLELAPGLDVHAVIKAHALRRIR